MIIAALFFMANAMDSAISIPMDMIEGDWVTADRTAIVRMLPCDDRPQELCGHMIWVEDPEWVDPYFLGGKIIAGFMFDRGAWRGGRLMNPGDGHTYTGSIRLDGMGGMRLKGCTLRVFCQSETWTRLDSLSEVGAEPEELFLEQVPALEDAMPAR